MQIAFEVILPIFGILGLGFFAAFIGKFSEEANQGLSLFVFDYALPLMVFRAIATAHLPDRIPWGYLGSYFSGVLIAFVSAMAIARRVFGRRLDEQGVAGLSASFMNGGFLGIPLVLTAYGPAASVPLLSLLACHSLIILPPATALIEAGRGTRTSIVSLVRSALGNVLRTPLIWGLASGLAFALLQVRIPSSIDVVVKGMSLAAGPCALFALGASLHGYKLGKNLKEPIVLVIIKTMVHPLLVWLIATYVFSLPKLWTAVAVTMAALPTGVTPYLFAKRYQACIEPAASAIFISTLFSVLTLSLVLYFFRM